MPGAMHFKLFHSASDIYSTLYPGKVQHFYPIAVPKEIDGDPVLRWEFTRERF